MVRRFTFVILALTPVVRFLVGAILTGGVARSVTAGPTAKSDDRRIVSRVHSGDTLTLFVSAPDLGQRSAKTLRLEDR